VGGYEQADGMASEKAFWSNVCWMTSQGCTNILDTIRYIRGAVVQNAGAYVRALRFPQVECYICCILLTHGSQYCGRGMTTEAEALLQYKEIE
jgi:hypothetical protein